MPNKPFIYFSEKLQKDKKYIFILQSKVKKLEEDMLFCQANILKNYKQNIIENYLKQTKDTPIHLINPDKLNLILWLNNDGYEYVPDTKIRFNENSRPEIRYKTEQGNWVEVK